MAKARPIVDYDDDEIAMPSARDLAGLQPIVNEAVTLARQIAELEEAIANYKTDYNTIVSKTLPSAMQKARMSEFKTDDGAYISMHQVVSGSLPKDTIKRETAIEWMEMNGAESLVKRKFSIQLQKGDDVTAARLRKGFASAGIDYFEDVNVHPQSLAAFARERLEKGEPVPVDTLGLYIADVAKIQLGSKHNAATSGSDKAGSKGKVAKAKPGNNPPTSKTAPKRGAPSSGRRSAQPSKKPMAAAKQPIAKRSKKAA